MSHLVYVTHEDKEFISPWYYDKITDPDILKLLWQKFNRVDPATQRTFMVWSRPTNWNMEVYIDFRMPPDSVAGRYRVEVFIPGEHATTNKAIYQVAHSFREEGGQTKNDEHVWVVNQFIRFDEWVPLGEFHLDPAANRESGRVRLIDLTREDPQKEIAYGPIRWVPLFDLPHGDAYFDSPVGAAAERAGPFAPGTYFAGGYPFWCGQWFDYNPFLSWYFLGYHTGADLNLPGGGTTDKGSPVYAAADGEVTFRGWAGGWGNLIVIEHQDALVFLPDGTSQRRVVHSRYGHLGDDMKVSRGETVKRGDRIGSIGLGEHMTSGWHLHFDISHSGILKTRPSHWPDMRKINQLKQLGVDPNSPSFKAAQKEVKQEVLANYVDPMRLIKANRD